MDDTLSKTLADTIARRELAGIVDLCEKLGMPEHELPYIMGIMIRPALASVTIMYDDDEFNRWIDEYFVIIKEGIVSTRAEMRESPAYAEMINGANDDS